MIPSAFLGALSSILSIVSSRISMNIPRWMAWYLDLRSWSITSCFLLGYSPLFIITLASCLTSVVTCLRWSLKFSMGFICTHSILCELLRGIYLMFVPSSNLIVLIWLLSRLVFALLIGFPYPQSALVASQLIVSSSSFVCLPKRCNLFICGWRFSRVPVVMLMSSA